MLGKEAEQVDHLEYLSAEPHLKEPSYNEVAYVINSLKNNKSAGLDGITAELIKNGGISLFERIYQLMMMIWNEEKLPEEWTIGIIQPIYKKGDKLICNNYTGITLLNVVYKILSGIIQGVPDHPYQPLFSKTIRYLFFTKKNSLPNPM